MWKKILMHIQFVDYNIDINIKMIISILLFLRNKTFVCQKEIFN